MGRQWWRGGYACECMILSVEDVVEPRLRAAGLLGGGQIVVFQYAYNDSVSASGGTHSEGGALDHGKGNDAETVIWRESGWADWQRGDPEDPHFDDHNHGIVQGCPHLSAAAADQVIDYTHGRNGLADGGPDKSPPVPPIDWDTAYDRYVSKGLFDMSDPIHTHRTVDADLDHDGDWHDIRIDDEANYSIASNTDALTVGITVHVAGLAVGETVDGVFRIASVEDGTPTTYPYTRTLVRAAGHGGTVTVHDTYNGGTGKAESGRSNRLRYALRTTSPTAKITTARIDGWRA